MNATDITVTLRRDDSDDGWNWAEAALAQWREAAEQAGLTVEVVSLEVPDVNYDAAVVEVDGEQYVVTVRSDDEVTARPHQGADTYTLVSAVAGDQMPEGAFEISDPACPLSWEDLPADAKKWAESNGYGRDADELLYVVPGHAQVEGWPTYYL